jgi:hypothetical protein
MIGTTRRGEKNRPVMLKSTASVALYTYNISFNTTVIESSVSTTNKAVVPSTNHQSSNKPTTTTKHGGGGGGGSGPVFVFGIDIDDELWAASPSPKNCPLLRPKNQMKALADETSKATTVNIGSPSSTSCTNDSSTEEKNIVQSKSNSTKPLSANTATENMPSPRTDVMDQDLLSQPCNDEKETNLACCDNGQDDDKLAAAQPLPFKLQHDPLGLLLFGLSD